MYFSLDKGLTMLYIYIVNYERIIMITSYIPIFQQKVDKIKQSLKSELELAKSDRRKDVIKSQIKELKSLKKTIKKAVGEDENKCPHCGKPL